MKWGVCSIRKVCHKVLLHRNMKWTVIKPHIITNECTSHCSEATILYFNGKWQWKQQSITIAVKIISGSSLCAWFVPLLPMQLCMGRRGTLFAFYESCKCNCRLLHGQVIRTKIQYIQWKGKPQSTRLLQLSYATQWSTNAINLSFMRRPKKEVSTSSCRACMCGLHLDSPVLCKQCTVSISMLRKISPTLNATQHSSKCQVFFREVWRKLFYFCTKGNKVARILRIAAPHPEMGLSFVVATNLALLPTTCQWQLNAVSMLSKLSYTTKETQQTRTYKHCDAECLNKTRTMCPEDLKMSEAVM